MKKKPEAAQRPPTIKFIRDSEHAVVPTRKHIGDVGYDLVLSRELCIAPDGFTDAHTDLRIALPRNHWAMITGRSSSLRTHGILVLTGIIDQGYTGPLHIAVHNMRNKEFHLEAGSRIAQLIIHEIHTFEWEEVEELPRTDRGDRGFGSTGA
jgi:dUTP pyrophosphatase